MTTESKGWVDNHYRTQDYVQSTPNGGISCNDMMAYYILMNHPDIIGDTIILYPSMWEKRERLKDMALSPAEVKKNNVFISIRENKGRIRILYARSIYTKFEDYELDEN